MTLSDVRAGLPHGEVDTGRGDRRHADRRARRRVVCSGEAPDWPERPSRPKTDAPPVARPGQPAAHWRRPAPRPLGAGVARSAGSSPRSSPRRPPVVSTGAHLVANGTLQSALWASLQRVFWGLAIGVPIGAALALAAGLSRVGREPHRRQRPDAALRPHHRPGVAVRPVARRRRDGEDLDDHARRDVPDLHQHVRRHPLHRPALSASWRTWSGWAGGNGSAASSCRRRCPASWSACAWPWRSPGCCSSSPSRSTRRAGWATSSSQAQTYFQSNVIVVCLACYAMLGPAHRRVRPRRSSASCCRGQPGR